MKNIKPLARKFYVFIRLIRMFERLPKFIFVLLIVISFLNTESAFAMNVVSRGL